MSILGLTMPEGGWFKEIVLDPSDPYFDPLPIKPKREPLHCGGCGRFARWAGDEHYYNGNWDCYRYTTHCSVCGDIDVECV